MNLVAIFRVAVIASLVFPVLAVSVDLLPGMVPPSVLAAVESNLKPGELFPAYAASLVLGVSAFVAAVGLLFFQKWARPLAVFTTAGSLALYPFTPAMPQSGWAALAFYLGAFVWGAALALAYFSPLSARFGPGS